MSRGIHGDEPGAERDALGASARELVRDARIDEVGAQDSLHWLASAAEGARR